MSAEAARIISRISGRKSGAGSGVLLGTVKAVSPLTVKFDEVGFDITTGLLVNSMLLGHQRTGNISSPAMSLPSSKINFDGGLLQVIGSLVWLPEDHSTLFYARW